MSLCNYTKCRSPKSLIQGGPVVKKELLKGLSNEQIAKIKKCKNTDEILALAKSEGTELTEEQLAAVSGGGCILGEYPDCPNCKSNDSVFKNDDINHSEYLYICLDCNLMFNDYD